MPFYVYVCDDVINMTKLAIFLLRIPRIIGV